jgi:hypothetical protein
MRWEELLSLVGDEPVFKSSLFITGPAVSANIPRQLSRWVSSGRLLQLRKGLYTLAEPYCKITPHPFLIANKMKQASYISTHSALAYHGLIPEYVPSVTSVSTGRPERVSTPLGNYIFRHIKTTWFYDYRNIDLGQGQSAFIASPEKALLDLVYLTPGSDNIDYLTELRLQNVEVLDFTRMIQLTEKSGSYKLLRAARKIEYLANQEKG